MGKRTVAVSVKMSEEDFAEIKRAADRNWPGAIMTNSGMVLSLAKIGARTLMKRKTKKKRAG